MKCRDKRKNRKRLVRASFQNQRVLRLRILLKCTCSPETAPRCACSSQPASRSSQWCRVCQSTIPSVLNEAFTIIWIKTDTRSTLNHNCGWGQNDSTFSFTTQTPKTVLTSLQTKDKTDQYGLDKNTYSQVWLMSSLMAVLIILLQIKKTKVLRWFQGLHLYLVTVHMATLNKSVNASKPLGALMEWINNRWTQPHRTIRYLIILKNNHRIFFP